LSGPDNLSNEGDLLVAIFRYSKDDLRVLWTPALLQALGQFRCGLPLAQPGDRDVADEGEPDRPPAVAPTIENTVNAYINAA